MHTSKFWKDHFQENLTKKRIDWSINPNITKKEKDRHSFTP